MHAARTPAALPTLRRQPAPLLSSSSTLGFLRCLPSAAPWREAAFFFSLALNCKQRHTRGWSCTNIVPVCYRCAGLLPLLKEVIEILFQEGLLKVR